MTATETEMVNESYEPSEGEERVLEVLKDGCGSGDPWGRVTPLYVREQTGIEKGNVEYYLRQLDTAGWINRVSSRGLYEFVEDPREGGDDGDE